MWGDWASHMNLQRGRGMFFEYLVFEYLEGPKSFRQTFSDSQPFSSRGTHKLITKILQHTKNIIFANLTKIDIILSHSHQTALLCWLLSFFHLTIKGKRGHCPWLNNQILCALKILAAPWLKITDSGHCRMQLKWILFIYFKTLLHRRRLIVTNK